MSVNAVSFGATTKNDNHYKKTHVGTIAGATAGVLYAAYDTQKSIKALKNGKAKRAITALADLKRKMIKSGMSKFEASSFVRKYVSAALVLSTATIALLGLGLGAAVNKSLNKHRAQKADAQ